MTRHHRARADLFTLSDRDHWLVVEDQWHRVMRAERLSAGADLLRHYLQLLLEYHDGGWKLHEFSSYWGYFYASRLGEQHYVQITSVDPALPKASHGNLMAGMVRPR